MSTRRQAIGLGIAGAVAFLNTAPAVAADEKYTGPIPPKKDVPYLMHADTLIETETATATQSSGKNEDLFVVPGETSRARTPLAEPIFILASERIQPASLGLYKFEVNGGKRQIGIPKKRGKNGPRVYHTSVRTLAPGLFRIEAAEYLENGEYSLSPEGENTAFCFTVY